MEIALRTLPSVREYIKSFENFASKAYLCPAGVWTIGNGATYYLDGSKVKKGDTIEKDAAQYLFSHHIMDCENVVNNSLPTVKLNDFQFSALVSLIYNIGSGNFIKSRVRLNIVRGYFDIAAESFMNHVYAYDKKKKTSIKLRGLVLRRKKEQEIFNTKIINKILPEEMKSIRPFNISNIQAKVLLKWYNKKFIMPKYIEQ
jgi:lysozyme